MRNEPQQGYRKHRSVRVCVVLGFASSPQPTRAYLPPYTIRRAGRHAAGQKWPGAGRECPDRGIKYPIPGLGRRDPGHGAAFLATNGANEALADYPVVTNGADLALAEALKAWFMADKISIDSPLAFSVVLLALNASPLASSAASKPGMRQKRLETSYSWPWREISGHSPVDQCLDRGIRGHLRFDRSQWHDG
uniref:Uncharacterized protein n=1 Tax=Candidatus Kentrum sp. DK TaxID=2126562 RepID=A0A450SAU9_9GAMM|nr:MAG: hypothetical protein BECKDK2373B_GA0170837_10237 [Candidatus Kentron sp. DK]